MVAITVLSQLGKSLVAQEWCALDRPNQNAMNSKSPSHQRIALLGLMVAITAESLPMAHLDALKWCAEKISNQNVWHLKKKKNQKFQRTAKPGLMAAIDVALARVVLLLVPECSVKIKELQSVSHTRLKSHPLTVTNGMMVATNAQS